METLVFSGIPSNVTMLAARVAAGLAVGAILFLISLHALSPEFDPSGRVVSEYANGKFGWVLSLMFGAWALSNWALALALSPQLKARVGTVGLCLLVAAGTGEAMAAIFDIHHPLHDLADAMGVPSMPIAAYLIGVSLRGSPAWATAKESLLWTSHLIWISLVLFLATMVLLVVTLHHAAGPMGAHLSQLPPGVIAVDGWANRLYVVTCCTWAIAVARAALNRRTSREGWITQDAEELTA
jgi:hypothetical protein